MYNKRYYLWDTQRDWVKYFAQRSRKQNQKILKYSS